MSYACRCDFGSTSIDSNMHFWFIRIVPMDQKCIFEEIEAGPKSHIPDVWSHVIINFGEKVNRPKSQRHACLHVITSFKYFFGPEIISSCNMIQTRMISRTILIFVTVWLWVMENFVLAELLALRWDSGWPQLDQFYQFEQF